MMITKDNFRIMSQNPLHRLHNRNRGHDGSFLRLLFRKIKFFRWFLFYLFIKILKLDGLLFWVLSTGLSENLFFIWIFPCYMCSRLLILIWSKSLFKLRILLAKSGYLDLCLIKFFLKLFINPQKLFIGISISSHRCLYLFNFKLYNN